MYEFSTCKLTFLAILHSKYTTNLYSATAENYFFFWDKHNHIVVCMQYFNSPLLECFELAGKNKLVPHMISNKHMLRIHSHLKNVSKFAFLKKIALNHSQVCHRFSTEADL